MNTIAVVQLCTIKTFNRTVESIDGEKASVEKKYKDCSWAFQEKVVEGPRLMNWIEAYAVRKKLHFDRIDAR